MRGVELCRLEALWHRVTPPPPHLTTQLMVGGGLKGGMTAGLTGMQSHVVI